MSRGLAIKSTLMEVKIGFNEIWSPLFKNINHSCYLVGSGHSAGRIIHIN